MENEFVITDGPQKTFERALDTVPGKDDADSVSETINDLRSSISGSVVIGQGHTVFDDAVDTNCR